MAEWPTLSLREAGVTLIDCVHKTPAAVPEGYPYIAIPQMKNGTIDFDDARRISEADFREWTKKARPHLHDVVLSRRTNPGVTATFGDRCDFALGQNLVLLRADGRRVRPDFLRWLVRSPAWWQQIDKFLNVGAVFDSLRCADLPRFELPIPPLSEQEKIASTLCALDDKIELNRRMNETLEAMARAIFEEAGRVSGWQPRPLNEYVAIFDGPHATPNLTQEGPIFLGISNLKSGMLDLSDTNHLSEADFQTWTRRVTPTRGDVVFSYETRLGQAALIPQGLRCCLGRRMGLLRPHHDRVAPVVLLRAYLSADFQEVIRKHTIHGATVERIPLKDMGDFPIRLPDPSQNPGLADQLAALRNLVEANQSESATLAATRDLLLPRLMSGELRVKDAECAVEEAA